MSCMEQNPNRCGMMRCIHLDTINTLQALYEEMQVKFIVRSEKVSSMGKERYVLIFPWAHNKAGKFLKGKHVRATLEEVSLDEEEVLKQKLNLILRRLMFLLPPLNPSNRKPGHRLDYPRVFLLYQQPFHC